MALTLLVASLVLVQIEKEYDGQAIYLVLPWNAASTENQLDGLGVNRIGPAWIPFVFFVEASRESKTLARRAGFISLPVGVDAAICGAILKAF
ncbi:MAG: hypothetical protein ABJL99_00705 [Aliishimia sp.]